jgi:hypothetical protein
MTLETICGGEGPVLYCCRICSCGPFSMLLWYDSHLQCYTNTPEDVLTRNDHPLADPWSGLLFGESGFMSCYSPQQQNSWLMFRDLRLDGSIALGMR